MSKEENNKVKDSIKSLAKNISNKAANAAENIGDFVAQKKQDLYKPIFESDLSKEDFLHERIIRIVNYDKRIDKEVCKGSIGFFAKTPGRKIPTFYTKYVGKLGFSFTPHLSESVFIADPCIEGKFIEIDEYFNYMKQVRVNELTVIAQALGAKHVDIRLITKKRKKTLVNLGANTEAGFKKVNIEADANRKEIVKSEEAFEIWASTDFKSSVWGGSPTVPSVLYFKNESDIQSLIQMVMVNKSKVTKRTYRMKASSSSGISVTEASNIGASLKWIKVKSGASLEKKATEENEAILEYTILF